MAKNEYKPVGMLQVDENAVSNAVNQMVGNNNTIIKNLQDDYRKQQDYELQREIADYNKYADQRNFVENQSRFNRNLAEKQRQGDRAYELGVRAQNESELNGRTNRDIARGQFNLASKQFGLEQQAVDEAKNLKANTQKVFKTILQIDAATKTLQDYAKTKNKTLDQEFLGNNEYFSDSDSEIAKARNIYFNRHKLLLDADPAALANVFALGSNKPEDQNGVSGIIGRLLGDVVRNATTILPVGGSSAGTPAQPAIQNPVGTVVDALQAIEDGKAKKQLTKSIQALQGLESSGDAYNSANAAGQQIQAIMPFAYEAFKQNPPKDLTWDFDPNANNPLENPWVKWFLNYLRTNGLTSSSRLSNWINTDGKNALKFYMDYAKDNISNN